MNKERNMNESKTALRRTSFTVGLAVLCYAFSTFATPQQQAKTAATKPTQVAQKAFDTPQLAAEALVLATESFDVPALLAILGPEGKDLVSSADPVQDKHYAQAFAAKAREKMAVEIDPKNPARATISTGKEGWPSPIPIVKKKGKWVFDSKAGRDEILFRRVGANELDAIQVCRGFVEAQEEYASLSKDLTGVTQYAQKIISTPGKRDGLYWENADGTAGGPVGRAVARAIDEGYTTGDASGYCGYYFKVLKGQGPAARMGQLDFVIKGAMIGGFALVAVPVEYGVTGVKTFMVSHDGAVYQKDLGPDSLKAVKALERYNPDKTWSRTDDQWPEDDSTAGEKSPPS